MNPTGNRIPKDTKNKRRHRYVLPVRIIIKNNAIMKTAVIAPAICDRRPPCVFGLANMRIDQTMIGDVSRSDRPMVRGAGQTVRGSRTLVAISFSP